MASYSRVYIQSRRRRRSHKGLHLKHVSRMRYTPDRCARARARARTRAQRGRRESRVDALCSTSLILICIYAWARRRTNFIGALRARARALTGDLRIVKRNRECALRTMRFHCVSGKESL